MKGAWKHMTESLSIVAYMESVGAFHREWPLSIQRSIEAKVTDEHAQGIGWLAPTAVIIRQVHTADRPPKSRAWSISCPALARCCAAVTDMHGAAGGLHPKCTQHFWVLQIGGRCNNSRAATGFCTYDVRWRCPHHRTAYLLEAKQL
eukprot:350848-Chlamydomonas_euryale.AAC.6